MIFEFKSDNTNLIISCLSDEYKIILILTGFFYVHGIMHSLMERNVTSVFKQKKIKHSMQLGYWKKFLSLSILIINSNAYYTEDFWTPALDYRSDLVNLDWIDRFCL